MSIKKEKLNNLRKILSEMGSILIAYSGGVDSTFLLKVAREELMDKVTAVTVKSEIHHLREMAIAKKMAQKFKVKHLFIDIDILSNKEFINNPPERCYICKKEIFSRISEMVKELSLNFVADGSNYDDLSDYRPGMKAVRELKIRSPLQEALLTKDDIRLLSKEMDLPTWNKPSNSCLATRIPYGDEITLEKLKRIEEAEDFIHNLGIKQVRVRYHNDLAKIEVREEDMLFSMEEDLRKRIITKLKKLGFIYITLDLQGYRSGSMNEELGQKVED
ncbi:MAG: ATP-dependent sacrificial sulfur transferase LarE [Candidatus Atribacteria bacterium]|nr:ATP-dependent sacrificial sulfur transferase LarE [Candidatus Atribacteria bacterium]